jgi:hypothetical protein
MIHTSALTIIQSTQVPCMAPLVTWNPRFVIVAHKQAILDLVETQFKANVHLIHWCSSSAAAIQM